MKTSPSVALAATLCLALAGLPGVAHARRSSSSSNNGNGNGNGNQETFPALPYGWLTAFPTMVQTGTKPTLTWGINYPSIVEDYVTIVPPATVEADEDIDCEVRILGAGVTVTSNGSSNYSFVPTQALMSVDGGSYQQIFYGTNLDVNPDQIVRSFTLRRHGKLKFGGRYYYNRSWGPYFTSDSGTDNVRTLVNGSTPPSNVPDYNAPSLESFIKPYLSPNGKVSIGPMDVIVFMELTHYDSQKSDPGYDLQDMVILVTFKSKAKTNNGHGNNLDGIDSSNPGNAPFINLDTDPTVDDEAGGGGAASSNP
ncbi:hypothetical protein [Haloferula sargassicola]|uniref:DUF4114 domain-containing protein n=1 Tax=Haloferula sargassicola TaxID=490096 RepID=A0ABP9UR25_9BACT